MMNYKVCMSVAGSDPSGGAGLQADLKVFTLLGCYGEAVPTALTVQSTRGVRESVAVDAALVGAQMETVFEDELPAAVKIGIVPNAAVAHAVADALERHRPPFVVLDPVLVSSSGRVLVDEAAREVLLRRLMPLCTLLTPNLPEAHALLGSSFADATPERLAETLGQRVGGVSVLVKGGHRAGAPVDVLYNKGVVTEFSASRVDTPNTHGTGCVLSSAIAAYVARGLALPEAVDAAKAFLTKALERGAAYRFGHGTGPLFLLPDQP